MVRYESLSFREEGDKVVVSLYNIFYFEVDRKEFGKVSENEAEIEERKFNRLLSGNIGKLRSKITGKKVLYIHRNSGIPLLGSGTFGIVDRGTNLIEVKPVTGCNLSCIYCSVDQDKRSRDIVIETDYLLEELQKIIEYKDCEVEAHIGCQGEAFIYLEMVNIIKKISQVKNVKLVSVDTNGTLLTKEVIDSISEFPVRLNISINSLNFVNTSEVLSYKADSFCSITDVSINEEGSRELWIAIFRIFFSLLSYNSFSIFLILLIWIAA